jgi:hypothetical protein
MWYDNDAGSNFDILFSIFRPDGSLVATDVFGSFSVDEETDPAIASLTSGGFVYAYTETVGGTDNRIRARIIQSNGSSIGEVIIANTTNTNSQSDPAVTGLADGGFMVVWVDTSGTAPDTSASAIRGQRFSATGLPVGDEFVLNTTTTNGQTTPDIATLTDGRFVVTWTDESSGNGDVRVQIFDPRGETFGGTDGARTPTTSARTNRSSRTASKTPTAAPTRSRRRFASSPASSRASSSTRARTPSGRSPRACSTARWSC